MGPPGTRKSLSMKSQLCSAILRQIIRYVICIHIMLCSSSSVGQGKYHNWAKSTKFLSKLPGDVKKHKNAAEEATHTLDHDLRERKVPE